MNDYEIIYIDKYWVLSSEYTRDDDFDKLIEAMKELVGKWYIIVSVYRR